MECAYKYLYALPPLRIPDPDPISVDAISTVTYQYIYIPAIMVAKLPANSQRVRRIPNAPLWVCTSSR